MYSTFVILMTSVVAFSSCGLAPLRINEFGVRAATGVQPSVSSTGSGNYAVEMLEKGGDLWTDRDYRFGDLPDEVIGGSLFSGPHRIPSESVLTLNGGQEGTMYAFLTKGRDGTYKSTLANSGWESTSLVANWLYGNSKQQMDVYRKTTTGSETLPAASGSAVVVFGFVQSPRSDVHDQCENLQPWCTNFNKETDCCSPKIQTSCPKLCHTCPARHCEWNDWVEGECSATCGIGTRDNTRTKSVVEANGGTCTGQPTETVECKIVECPIPCEWSEWTVGECSEPCGGGVHTKTRTEDVSADHGGEECNAEHSTIEESCNVQECPVHCEWSTWTIGQCSKTCGGGQRTDTRRKDPEELFGGDPCEGDASQQVSCNTDECAVCRTKDDKDSVTGMPPNPNVPCHFPFNWNGKTYNECTEDDHAQKWCGTQADVSENTTSLLEFGVTEGWGNCEETEICGHVADQGCATGYTRIEKGDIPGMGKVNGRGDEQVSSCSSCAELCSSDADCGSYECDPEHHKGITCNFNEGKKSTTTNCGPVCQRHRFCVKD